MNAVEIVKTFITALQSGDLETASRHMSDDFIITGLDTYPLGKEAWLVTQSQLLAAIPDFSYNLDDVQQNGPHEVTALIQVSGTHQRTLHLTLLRLPPLQATGLFISLPQVHSRYTLAGEQVKTMAIENLPGGGLLGLIQQVGDELPLQRRGRNIAD